MPNPKSREKCYRVLEGAYAAHLDEEHRRSIAEVASVVDKIAASIAHDETKKIELHQLHQRLSDLVKWPTKRLQDVASKYRQPPKKRGAPKKTFRQLKVCDLVVMKFMHALHEVEGLGYAAAAEQAAIEFRQSDRQESLYRRYRKKGLSREAANKQALIDLANETVKATERYKQLYRRWREKARPIIDGRKSPQHDMAMRFWRLRQHLSEEQ